MTVYYENGAVTESPSCAASSLRFTLNVATTTVTWYATFNPAIASKVKNYYVAAGKAVVYHAVGRNLIAA